MKATIGAFIILIIILVLISLLDKYTNLFLYKCNICNKKTRKMYDIEDTTAAYYKPGYYEVEDKHLNPSDKICKKCCSKNHIKLI